MIDWLIQLDHDIILGLNALHTPVLDSIMLFLSSSKVWIPLYVLIAALITEQITNLVKDWVARPRPSHDPLLEDLLHLPEGRGGLYGFFSAHASNTFGMAALTALIFRRGWYSAGILTWAALIGFSRIYLAKHFTTDVVCGALAGVLVALAVYCLYRWILALISRKYS